MAGVSSYRYYDGSMSCQIIFFRIYHQKPAIARRKDRSIVLVINHLYGNNGTTLRLQVIGMTGRFYPDLYGEFNRTAHQIHCRRA